MSEKDNLDQELVVDIEGEEVEIEITDDTPEQDRGRTPLPAEVVKELENDPLTDYSERVRQRISQAKRVYHDERRQREAAERERNEALRLAQAAMEENRRMKVTLSSGEQDYVKTLQTAAEQELASAKASFRQAYEEGDPDKVLEAQERLQLAQINAEKSKTYKKQYELDEAALQELKKPVNILPQQSSAPRVGAKTNEWVERNSWFKTDPEMYAAALGLHDKLVSQGVEVESDKYFEEIDKTMRRRFPEYQWDDTQGTDKSPSRKKSQVVAPATRSTAPKRVVLTKTQIDLCKKLGITPEQYARESMKLENEND